MTARVLIVALLASATVAGAVEFPDVVSASKCKGRKKIFGFIDDPTGTPTVRKIKIGNSFYVEAGSAFVQGCKTFRGSDECRETFGLGLFLSPGVTGQEILCNSQSGLPYISYSVAPEDGGEPVYWTNTANCTVTVVKYDEERGRLKGMYRTELLKAGPSPVYAEFVGCFSAKRQ